MARLHNDGRLYALNAQSGALKWKFVTGGERRFERNPRGSSRKTRPLRTNSMSSFPVRWLSRERFTSAAATDLYAVDANSGELRWKPDRRRRAFFAGSTPTAPLLRSLAQLLYAADAVTGKEKWRFQAGEDPLIHNQVGFQSSAAVVNGVVYVGCRDSNLYAFDAATGKEKWRFNNEGSWVITSPAVKDGKVFFATSDSSLYRVVDAATGKSLLREDTKAYVFSSPAIAGDVVVYGVLNGTLQARDVNTGTLLWEDQTEASKANKGWVLTSERKFNGPLVFHSPWREAATVAVDRQFNVGAIFSSPLIINGIVYFTSTDGCLYTPSSRFHGFLPSECLTILKPLSARRCLPTAGRRRLRWMETCCLGERRLAACWFRLLAEMNFRSSAPSLILASGTRELVVAAS